MLAKLLTQLIYPLNLSLLLMLAAGLAFWRGRRRAGGFFLALAVLCLWAFSLPVVSERLRAGLERQFDYSDVATLPGADAIVVLGGGVSAGDPPRRPYPDLNAAADRVWHAARLYDAGKAPLVIVSGGRSPGSRASRSQAGAMAELLDDLGVPADAILQEPDSANTFQNARNTAVLLAGRDLRRVLLVTSALHMPRALATFRAAGVDAVPAATDFEADVTMPFGRSPFDWLPSAGALLGSGRALKEYLGLWVYRLRGQAL